MKGRNAYIPRLSTREEYFDLFDGLAANTVEDAEKKRLRAGLQKTYLLETLRSGTDLTVEAIWTRSGLDAEIAEDDGSIFRITDRLGNSVGVLERVTERYFMFYTFLPSAESDRLIRSAVAGNPWLDHLWISSQSFRSLWDYVRSVNSGRRYGKITFEHEAVFEVIESDGEILPHIEDERRASRFTMVDQIDEIERQMEPLQATYAPLASITHLRIPGAGPGGHELYFDGKATNRSNSFLNHRSELLNVVNMYSQLTTRVEESLWVSGASSAAPQGLELNAAVAELIFSEELPEETFRRWMMNLFSNRRNRFRISGYPTWLGERRVQANALDQHLWQPLVMEFTTKRVVAILPEGTCGNTINRLISNVQRYIDPRVTAFVGEQEYSSLIPAIGMRNVG